MSHLSVRTIHRVWRDRGRTWPNGACSATSHQLPLPPLRITSQGSGCRTRFNNKAKIALLQPESTNDSESEEKIRHKLYAELSLGYPPAGVDAKAGSERETERKKKYAERIRGSGISSSRATWTLRENSQARDGIYLRFVGVLVIKVEGELEVDIEIRATIGAKPDDPLRSRSNLTELARISTVRGVRQLTINCC
jgi:hypothetical protein